MKASSTAKRSLRVMGIGLIGLAATSIGLVTSQSRASADYQPDTYDIVGVGGDTAQYSLDFLANGDPFGAAGFDGSNPIDRLVTIDATSDANGRQSYTNSLTSGAPSALLNPTVVLRAGTFPVQRISSSGSAISALLLDTNSPEQINFVFSSSLPSAANDATAASNNWGYLHVVEFGTDQVEIATNDTTLTGGEPDTNAPALTMADLVNIYNGTYTTWGQVPGDTTGSTEKIIAELPPSTSALYKTLSSALQTFLGNNPSTTFPFANTVAVEQNDPTAITSIAEVAGTSGPQDAIVPFSLARDNLWNGNPAAEPPVPGYFHNPATVYPGSSTALSPGISLQGELPDSYGQITDYVIFRQSDYAEASPMEPGGSHNWVQTLFSNGTSGTGTGLPPTAPFVGTAKGQALIAAAGVTPFYDDLGEACSSATC